MSHSTGRIYRRTANLLPFVKSWEKKGVKSPTKSKKLNCFGQRSPVFHMSKIYHSPLLFVNDFAFARNTVCVLQHVKVMTKCVAMHCLILVFFHFLSFALAKDTDIIDEAIYYFKANVFFKNYEIKVFFFCNNSFPMRKLLAQMP